MLYWGYRSPWWLQYGDTYFESGAHIEAASPTESLAPYARDSVTHRLDQAQSHILDTPWLGKDSLGIWLSDWSWNSGIGKSSGNVMSPCTSVVNGRGDCFMASIQDARQEVKYDSFANEPRQLPSNSSWETRTAGFGIRLTVLALCNHG